MRKSIIFCALLISIFAVWSLICCHGFERIVSNMSISKPVIIIDAGHGGFDGGAVAHDGTIEKDINLSISKKLAEIAELGGYQVIMVRSDDTAVCDEGLDTIRKKKSSDIHNRYALAEKHPEAVFISIHQNHFEQAKYWGTQVFYGVKNPNSQKLAANIQKAVCENLQKDNTREIKKAEKNLYILYNTNSTAVMVECGFLSNKDECAKLCSDEYQQQLAFEIFRAVDRYFLELSNI